MRSTFGVIGIAILAMASTSAAEYPAKVHYVANEGLLVEVGATKVLIDALFDDRSIAYCQVPDEMTLREMENAEAPFDGVDLFLVSPTLIRITPGQGNLDMK